MQTKQQGIIKAKAAAPAVQQPRSIKQYLKVYEKEITKALPAQIGADRFNRICATAVLANAGLGECTPESFIGSVLACAQTGLEPNTPLGHAYLIPYKNKKGQSICTLQIGYKGLIDLVRRSGEVSVIKAVTVYENDEFSYTLGLDPAIHHVPAKGDRGTAVAYYAYYKTKSGDYDFEVMYREEIERHRKAFSKAGRSSWTDPNNYDAMAKKTVLKRLLKYAPMSVETARAVAQDCTSKVFNSNDVEGMKDLSIMPSTLDYEDAEFVESEPQKQMPEVPEDWADGYEVGPDGVLVEVKK